MLTLWNKQKIRVRRQKKYSFYVQFSDISRLCLFSALLAIPPFFFFLFVSGLSDHFFAIPFEQFQWSSSADVNVAEAVFPIFLFIFFLQIPIRFRSFMNWLANHWVIPFCAQWTHGARFRLRWLSRTVFKIGWPKNAQFWLWWKARRTGERCLNLFLANFYDFLKLLFASCSKLSIFQQREAIRATFGSLRRFPPEKLVADRGGGAAFRLRTIFVLGRPALEEKIAQKAAERLLEEEAKQHKDLLVGDFTDSYFNNTLKVS